MTLTYFRDYQEIWNGCVLYMDGSSPTQEIIGSHTITNNGSVAVTGTDRFGKTNRALSFNGSSQYLTIPHDATNLVFGTGNFAISLWFNPTNTTTEQLICKGSNADYNPIGVLMNYGSSYRIATYVDSNNTWDVLSNAQIASGVSLNAWHHLLFIRSGTTYISYFDGVGPTTLGTGKSQSFKDSNTNPWGIGATSNGENKFTGAFGEVAIWKGTIPDPKQLYLLTSKKYLYPILPGVRGVY